MLNNIVNTIVNDTGGLPDFVVFLGDLGNWASHANNSIYDDWQVAMKPLTDMGVEIYNVVGNHDLYDIDVIGDNFLKYLGYGVFTDPKTELIAEYTAFLIINPWFA